MTEKLAAAREAQTAAQAQAFQEIAQQIGSGNAALLEMLKVIGERGIQITPRVMVSDAKGGAAGATPETIALIGTMLDSMIAQERPAPMTSDTRPAGASAQR